jgi:hypothetical protein
MELFWHEFSLFTLKTLVMKVSSVFFLLLTTGIVFSQELAQKLDAKVYTDMQWVASGGENFACGLSNVVVKPTQFYTVVTVTDKNSGEVKQLATLYRDLRSAVNMDRASFFNPDTRQVTLTDEAALRRIGFLQYDLNRLKKIQESISILDFYKKAISDEHKETVLLDIDETDHKYYAHLLFNEGAMSGYIPRAKEFVVYDKRATSAFKQELIESLIPKNYIPDTKIGDATLLDPNNITSFFGEESMHHLTPMGEEGNEFEQVSLLTRNKREKITLIAHPGNVAYAFSVFRVELADEKDSELFTTNVTKFVSESGVTLGMSEADFNRVKGKPSVTARKGDNVKVMNYCIVEIYDHELLREYNLPAYSATYTFENGVLTAFEFGFVNP